MCFSGHAQTQWAVRFGQYNMREQFDRSKQFYTSYGTTYRLSPCRAIFIVSPGQVVVTVLTIRIFNRMRRSGSSTRHCMTISSLASA